MKTIVSIFIFVLYSMTSFAQETWDLERCINYAIEHSIDVNQADLSILDANVVEKISSQQKLPDLTGSTGLNTNFGRSVDPTTNEFVNRTFLTNGYGLNSNMILYNGGRLKNDVKRSQINILASEEDKKSAIAAVSLNVVTAYFEALLSQDNFSNTELQLKTITDQIDQLRKLVDAGSRAAFEIYDLEAQQAQSEQQVTIAQNNIDLAILRLKGIMNYNSTEEMTLVNPPLDQLTYTDVDAITFDQVYDKVLETRPELRAYDLRIRSSEYDIEIAKSASKPFVGVGGNLGTNFSKLFNAPFSSSPYFDQIAENLSFNVGFQVNIPILDRYNTKGNTERARINVENVRAEKERYILDLRNIMGQYLTDAKASKRNLEASEKVLAARQIAFENAEKRFKLGAINSFDYTSIQDQLNTARTEQLIAKYDYMMKIKVLDFYQGYPVSLR